MLDSKIIGRYIEEDNKVKHFWTGSGIEFTTNSPELVLKVFAEYSKFEIWVAVELNGARILRTMLLPGMNAIPVFRNLNPNEAKRVRVIRDSQATLDEDANYMSVVEAEDFAGNKIPTTATPDNKLSIEFIGDSITSGEGLKGAKEDMDFAYCYTSFDGNYASLVARELDADYSVISQCGYGISCGWNNDPSMKLPVVYKYADGRSREYNFEKKFDYVVINLGTNDNGAMYQEPFEGYKTSREEFREGMVDFLNYVMEKNPDSKIIWIIGMCEIDLAGEIKAVIESMNSSRITFLKAKSCDELDFGERSHPGPLTHREAAKMVIEEITHPHN